MMSKGRRESDGNNALYYFASGLDRAVNIIALVLFLILLLYVGHSLWYSHSVQEESFLPEELAKYRPDGQEPSLNELKEINSDVIAWITINDTNIDYPVVQGKDNSEYLNKTVLGEFSLAGSLFLEASNRKDFKDPYNMVYGHHVEGGAMLSDVVEFRNASFFKTHKTGILWYPDKDSKAKADRIEIFAALDINASDDIVYAQPSTVTSETITEVTDYIKEKAIQKRKTDIDKGSRVIGLSTCEDAVSFDRELIFGKLVPMTDSEIKAAQEKLREKSDSEKKGQGLIGAINSMPPWVLPSAGALLLILVIYVLWRKYRQVKEDKKHG